MTALLTPRGRPGAALEEVLERPIEVPQDLLLAVLGDGRDPIERGAQDRQLTALSRIAQPQARMAMELARLWTKRASRDEESFHAHSRPVASHLVSSAPTARAWWPSAIAANSVQFVRPEL
jgi:hypothetical protein